MNAWSKYVVKVLFITNDKLRVLLLKERKNNIILNFKF